LSWGDIYRGWDREDLQYYWRARRYAVEEWDPAFHELPAGHLEGALQTWTSWRPENHDALVDAIRQRPDELKLVQERMRERARQQRIR
jgi:hypothetical protein